MAAAESEAPPPAPAPGRRLLEALPAPLSGDAVREFLQPYGFNPKDGHEWASQWSELPELTIRVVDQAKFGGHNYYSLDCALARQGEWHSPYLVWSSGCRLSQLREGLHDPVVRAFGGAYRDRFAGVLLVLGVPPPPRIQEASAEEGAGNPFAGADADAEGAVAGAGTGGAAEPAEEADAEAAAASGVDGGAAEPAEEVAAAGAVGGGAAEPAEEADAEEEGAARGLTLWAKNELGLLHQQERAEAAGIRDLEKIAQLEALLLMSAVEMAVPAITAERHDDEDGEVASPTGLRPLLSDVPPSPHLSVGSRGPDGPPPPPSSKVLYTTKPILKREMFDAAIYVVNFHSTFPSGIRERLHDVLVEEYSLTTKQLRRLTKSTTQSVNGPRLTQSELYEMEQHEKTRLRQHHADHASDTSHLLAPSLVPVEADIGKPAKYTTWTPPRSAPGALDCRPSGSIDGGGSLTRDRRSPFRVSKGTGPLTWSTELKQLRSTGYFFRMPPLA